METIAFIIRMAEQASSIVAVSVLMSLNIGNGAVMTRVLDIILITFSLIPLTSLEKFVLELGIFRFSKILVARYYRIVLSFFPTGMDKPIKIPSCVSPIVISGRIVVAKYSASCILLINIPTLGIILSLHFFYIGGNITRNIIITDLE